MHPSLSTEAGEKCEGRESLTHGFALTADDIEILSLILEHRFLHRQHVASLVGRHPKRVHRRLSKLEEQRYLRTIRMPQQKYLYCLAKNGVQTLVEQGKAEPEMLCERSRSHELSELFLKHEMMIVDIHVRFSLASDRGAVRVQTWKEGCELYDSIVAVDQKGSSRLPVRPDAFLVLLDSRRPEGANRANFMLEADRSTTTQTRFQEKLRAYAAYLEQGRQEKKFGIKGFRVLTIALSDARTKNLVARAAAILPERMRKYFLFTTLARFMDSTDPIGEPLYYFLHAPDVLQPLVSPPQSA